MRLSPDLPRLMASAFLCLALIGLNPTRATAQTLPATAGQFEAGLVLIEVGKPREAADAFAAILSRNPDLVRVRLELARACFLSRQWGRSRAEFLSVLSGDLPAPVRANVLRFLREIDARRGFQWDAEVAFATLGETRDYASDTVTVPGVPVPLTVNGRDGKTVQGLTYVLSATLSENIPGLSSQTARTLGFGRLTASGDEGPGSRFDDLTLTAELGARVIFPQSTLTLAPALSRRVRAGAVYEDRLGLRTTFQTRRRTGTTMAVSATWAGIDRHGSDSQDGHSLIASASASHPVTPRATLGMRMAVEHRDAQSPSAAFRRARLTAFGAFDVGRGITLRPRVYFERRKVERPTPFVADETGLGAALTVESSRIILGNGFTPYARVSFERVTSDLDAFSYRDTAASIGLERRF